MTYEDFEICPVGTTARLQELERMATTQQSENTPLHSVVADGETLVLQWQIADRSKGFSILFAADGTVSLATKRSKTEFYANNCKEYRLDSPDLEEAIKSGFTAVNERPALLARIRRLEEALLDVVTKAPGSGPLWYGSEEIKAARAALTE